MNFLALCQQTVIECGAQNVVLGATANQSGEALRFVGWVQQAWSEIQTARDDWGFLKSSYLNGAGASFTTSTGTQVYPLGTGANTVGVDPNLFGRWDRYSFRDFTTSVTSKQDEVFLDPISYDDWRDAYMLGALRSVRTRPITFAVAPNNSICLGPPSNGLYTVEGDYWAAPQQFANDADVPQGLPVRFHMLIVYRAMKKYAGYSAAPEVQIRANDEYIPMYKSLESLFAPEITGGAALA